MMTGYMVSSLQIFGWVGDSHSLSISNTGGSAVSEEQSFLSEYQDINCLHCLVKYGGCYSKPLPLPVGI